MNPQPFQNSSNQNFPQDPQPSMNNNPVSFSKAEYLHQLKEPLLGRSVQIPSAVNPKSEGSKSTLKKVKDIDRKLGEGWFFAYELWLYVIIVLAPSKAVFMCGWMYEMWNMTIRRETDQAWFKAFSILLIFALYYTYWSVRQTLLHKEALRKKDEKIAAQAYSSVVRLSIHYFILCVIFLCVGRYFEYYYFNLSDSWRDFLFNIGYPCFQFISHYAIPVPISIYGSYKIKILLEERKNLIGETEIIQEPYLPLDPLSKKLQEIDQELDRGWLFLIYKIWLYLSPVWGFYLYGELRVSHGRYDSWGVECSGIPDWILRGYAFHCFFWLLRQAWLQIIAMKQKDAKVSTKAYDSLIWLAKYFSIWVLFGFWDFLNSLWYLPGEQKKYAVGILLVLFVRFIYFYLIPVGISIYGSRKVKNSLKERQALIPDGDNDDGSSGSQV